jgi:L-threonylcarbamoyladenylate synthase
VTTADAARLIRAGELVAFPTETVYGLGANALDQAAVEKIFALKQRPRSSPLIVHVSSIAMARSLVRDWPPLADELAARWWPGPLSLVLPKRPEVPALVTAGLATVGVRMPDHPVALELIREAGVPIAAPSANLFTGISPTTPEHVRTAFGDSIPIVEGGPSRVGIESTVVAIENGRLKLLRPGMISLGDLEAAVARTGEAHSAPGMHEKHYSPRTPLFVGRAAQQGRGGWIWYRTPNPDAVRSIQLPADPAGYAAGLYAALHELDAAKLEWIAVEPLPHTAEWAPIQDRLKRASGGRILE